MARVGTGSPTPRGGGERDRAGARGRRDPAPRNSASNPLLIVAIMAVESSLDPRRAVGNMGAQGLMQVIPRYHKDKIGPNRGRNALFDPRGQCARRHPGAARGAAALWQHAARPAVLQRGAGRSEGALHAQGDGGEEAPDDGRGAHEHPPRASNWRAEDRPARRCGRAAGGNAQGGVERILPAPAWFTRSAGAFRRPSPSVPMRSAASSRALAARGVGDAQVATRQVMAEVQPGRGGHAGLLDHAPGQGFSSPRPAARRRRRRKRRPAARWRW